MTDQTNRPMHAVKTNSNGSGFTAHLGPLEDCALPECVTAATLGPEQAAHEEHRRQLADALGEARGRSWDHLIGRAETVRADLDELRAALDGDQPAETCPGREAEPNRCTCDCEGCTHNCAAHQPAEAQPEPESGRDTNRPFEQRRCAQANCIGAHRYMYRAKVYDCPGPATEPLPHRPLNDVANQLATAVHAYLAAATPLATQLARALGLTKDGE
jgi:hypothetical protein